MLEAQSVRTDDLDQGVARVHPAGGLAVDVHDELLAGEIGRERTQMVLLPASVCDPAPQEAEKRHARHAVVDDEDLARTHARPALLAQGLAEHRFPAARVAGNAKKAGPALARGGRDGALDGPPEVRRQPQGRSASSSSSARRTASGGTLTRLWRYFGSPGASPAGRGKSRELTTRCATCHGPHSEGSLGPKSATQGVCIAAAMCMGTESTPTCRRARSMSAASSGSVSRPARSSGRASVHAARMRS